MDCILARSAILALDAGPGIVVRISGLVGSASILAAAMDVWRTFWLLDTFDSRNNVNVFEVFILTLHDADHRQSIGIGRLCCVVIVTVGKNKFLVWILSQASFIISSINCFVFIFEKSVIRIVLNRAIESRLVQILHNLASGVARSVRQLKLDQYDDVG